MVSKPGSDYKLFVVHAFHILINSCLASIEKRDYAHYAQLLNTYEEGGSDTVCYSEAQVTSILFYSIMDFDPT